jgi:putative nucleotidyltransferase with HDIG domain
MVKLLVADDEQKICRLLETFFSERGYEVLLAHDGASALEVIQRERPHLVFLDLRMPGLSGLEVLKEAHAVDATMKVIIITAIEDEETIQQARALGATDYVIKPFSLEYLKDEVLSKVSTSLYEDLRRVNEELKGSLERMKDVVRGIVSAFSSVVSKIDPHYTHEHVVRSVDYATRIVQKLRQQGLSLGTAPEEVLLAGVLLHDIGKIFTPKEILYKNGPLNDEEWAIIRRHPVDGADILQQIGSLKEMADTVRHHHECYDGSGYPDGLKGEEIPLGSRIASVVDAFDAMVSDRPYRKAMPIEKAIAELQRCRGTQFDPQVVDAVLALYAEGNLKPCDVPHSHEIQPPNASPLGAHH